MNTNPIDRNEPRARPVEFLQDLRRAWSLLLDKRVPFWTKLIPALSVVYLISPIDLLADPVLGLGQLDDLAVLWLGLRLFLAVCAKYSFDEPVAMTDTPNDIQGAYELLG